MRERESKIKFVLKNVLLWHNTASTDISEIQFHKISIISEYENI